VNNTVYSDCGVEIEDDLVPLRRRQVEFGGDAAAWLAGLNHGRGAGTFF
jgi:hypothetical protein